VLEASILLEMCLRRLIIYLFDLWETAKALGQWQILLRHTISGYDGQMPTEEEPV
jgi:hypothetical protein